MERKRANCEQSEERTFGTRSATGEKFKEEFCGSHRQEREGGRLHPKNLFAEKVSERSTLKMKTPGDTGKSNCTTTKCTVKYGLTPLQ